MKDLIVLLLISSLCFAGGRSSYCGHSSSHIHSSKRAATHHVTTRAHRNSYSGSTSRDSDGRKGYVIDHIVSLSKGGADSPSNMQWQTKEDAKAKDKWERGGPSKKNRP